jgi:ribosomal protein S18 acetylase RimI-like enzyme
LLETVLNSLPKHPNIARVFLHVQTSNEDAIAFYKKFGFTITETIKDYYKRITPPDCYVLSKDITATGGDTDASVVTGSGAGTATAADAL